MTGVAVLTVTEAENASTSPTPSRINELLLIAEKKGLNPKNHLPISGREIWIELEVGGAFRAPVKALLGMRVTWNEDSEGNHTVTFRVDAFPKTKDEKRTRESAASKTQRGRRLRLFQDNARDCLEIPIVREVLEHTHAENPQMDGLTFPVKDCL